jgi:hypothetical protein
MRLPHPCAFCKGGHPESVPWIVDRRFVGAGASFEKREYEAASVVMDLVWAGPPFKQGRRSKSKATDRSVRPTRARSGAFGIESCESHFSQKTREMGHPS